MEQRNIEEKLYQSEERYRMLFEYMSNAVLILQAQRGGDDYVIQDINQSGQWIEKVKKEEVVGKSIRMVQPDVMENGVFETLQRVWRFGEPAHFPVSIYDNDYNVGWREHWIYKLPSGEIVLLYEDIKDWKRIEEKLNRSEHRNRALLVAIPDTIFLFSKSGICIDCISGNASHPNSNSEPLIEKHIYDFLPWDTARKIMDGIQRAVAGEGPYTVEYSLVSDRKVRHFEGRVTAAGRDEVVFIVRDITEQQELYRELSQQEERFRTIVEFLPIGYSEIDRDMNVMYANETAYSITGYNEDDKQEGLNLRRMLVDFEAAVPNFRLGLEGKRPYPAQYTIRRKDGKEIDVLIKSSPIEIAGDIIGLRCIIIDVSYRV